MRTGFSLRAGGRMMARNMPKIAIPSALRRKTGSSVPATAPRIVPTDQPRYGAVINPYKYQ